MNTTIHGTIRRIKSALDTHFSGRGFEWKTEESQSEHVQGKPTVFALVCAERSSQNFPVVCPSVTIELRGAHVESSNQIRLDVMCHCVVVNSAILEREKTIEVDGFYHFLDVDGYTMQGVVEALFSDCMLLGEETLNALRGVVGVTDLALIPPRTLEDFPYCQCQVLASVSMLTQFIKDEFL